MEFQWIPYYTEFADCLRTYRNRRADLLTLLHSTFSELRMKDPFMDGQEPLTDICPFTVFGCFNKGLTDQNRISILSVLGSKLGIKAPTPRRFDGIPLLSNMNSWFFSGKTERKPDDIENLWNMFEACLRYAETKSAQDRAAFVADFNMVLRQGNVKWNITMGLFWVRPLSYLNLDERNRAYLLDGRNPLRGAVLVVSNLRQVPNGETYLRIVEACQDHFGDSECPAHSFPELSVLAFNASSEGKSAADAGDHVSNAGFLKWFTPILHALNELGGSGTPEQVRRKIVADLSLPDEVVNERRGKTSMKKFDNDVAWARNYLNYEGYLDSPSRGVWRLTEKGRTSPMDEKIAGNIFFKWVDILKQRRGGADAPEEQTNEKHFWRYAPGENAFMWDAFYEQGVMGIGWEEAGYKR